MKISLVKSDGTQVEVDLEEICTHVGVFGVQYYLIIEEFKKRLE